MNIEKIIPLLLEQQRRFVATGGGAQTAPIQIKRPKWDDVYANYPKNATGSDDLFGPDFYEKLFGKRYNKTTYLLDNKTKLYNGCAGKVSTALALSGCYIQKTGGIGIDFIASENTLKSKSLNNVTMKDKGFISTASKMKKWLDAAWKQDGDIKLESAISITSFAKLVGSKKGIYLMLAENQTDFGASGHVTLWTGENGKYAFGGHHYDSYAKAMYFWELK